MSTTTITQEIEIEAKSTFLEDYSRPDENSYFYSYLIKILNNSDRDVQILSRRWIILDSYAKKEVITGKGIVGKQPIIKSGQSHQYTSYCPLPTNFGSMEGTLTVKQDQNVFDLQVNRFFLAANLHEFGDGHFRRGQIVHHKKYNYRGVVVDYDMNFTGDDDWYSSNRTQPDKAKPWYQVLVDNTDRITYVAHENLELAPSTAPVSHPLIDYFFEAYNQTSYSRNKKTWRDMGN